MQVSIALNTITENMPSWYIVRIADVKKMSNEKKYSRDEVDKILATVMQNNSSENWGDIRNIMSQAMSGGYDHADTMHNIYLDFGYPLQLSFFNWYNMYKRFGIAGNIVELPVDTGWKDTPRVIGSNGFNNEFETLVKQLKLWTRLKGWDIRQRVGQYAGLFMRVRDNTPPDQPIEGKLNGVASIVDIVPLYESQLLVKSTEQNPKSDDFGQPTMYSFSGNAIGASSDDINVTFDIHPDRVIVIGEGSDDGSIYGESAINRPYNSLMDMRKIIGAGGEGFYKNASKDIVWKLTDASSAIKNKDLLDKFNEQADDFTRNRFRRSMWAPGLEPDVLQSDLSNPKEFFFNALYDAAASSKIPATVIIGQQTGRLASSEDSRHFLSTCQSRRENHQTDMIVLVVDWLMLWGAVVKSDYEVEWDDLLSQSDAEKLDNSTKMSEINKNQFLTGGGAAFSGEEIREVAGFDPEELPEPDETNDDENES